MAKVAIDIRLLGADRTGDETVFFELTKKLIHEHPEHQYVLLTDKKGEVWEKIPGRLNLGEQDGWGEVVHFGSRNKFWWNAVTMPLFFHQRKDIEVFHTQYILPLWLPKKLAVVAHIHDISFARYPQYIARKDLFFLDWFIPATLRRAFLVTPSHFTKEEIINVYQVPAERITVVPNALGEAFLQAKNTPQDPARFEEVRGRYGLPETYFLYVGTLQPRKNIPYLLEMFAESRKKHSALQNTSLVLVGSKKAHHFDPKIDQTIKKLGLDEAVIFPGYVDALDLPLVYQQAKAFVFPSLYEGFGLPLLEAEALGVPTLASDIPVHREIGGPSTVFFPLDDVVKAGDLLYTMCVTGASQGHSEALQSQKNQEARSWSKSASLLARLYQKITTKENL